MVFPPSFSVTFLSLNTLSSASSSMKTTGLLATAFVGSLASGMMDGMAILTGVIIERVGYRKTAIAGDTFPSTVGSK